MSNLKLPNLNYTNLVNRVAQAEDENRPALLNLAYATTLTPGHLTGTVHVVHHTTAIATLAADGSIAIDNGGWASMTTLQRLDRVLLDNRVPFRIARRDGRACILDTDLHIIARGFQEATFVLTDDGLTHRLSWADADVNHKSTAVR